MRLLYCIVYLVLTSRSLGVDQQECRVEHSFAEFYYQNGGKPPQKDELESEAKEAALDAITNGAEEWVEHASNTLGTFLKGAGFYITLSSYISTNRLAFQTGLVCTYRFIHKNKIHTEFQIRRIPRVENDSTRDWYNSDEEDRAKMRLNEEKEKMIRELDEELKKNCEQHDNN